MKQPKKCTFNKNLGSLSTKEETLKKRSVGFGARKQGCRNVSQCCHDKLGTAVNGGNDGVIAVVGVDNCSLMAV
ncbi:hypothetical protein L195_g046368, partial [Trifolium pratense]